MEDKFNTENFEKVYESYPMVKIICDYLNEYTYKKIIEQHKEATKMLTETIKALCISGCNGGGCYRLFTCSSWPNSRLYAVGPNKIWFDKLGRAKIKNSGNYDLLTCLSYCDRKRDPWKEVKTLDEIKSLYV